MLTDTFPSVCASHIRVAVNSFYGFFPIITCKSKKNRDWLIEDVSESLMEYNYLQTIAS